MDCCPCLTNVDYPPTPSPFPIPHNYRIITRVLFDTKALCFWYDERYSLGNKGKKKQTFVLQLQVKTRNKKEEVTRKEEDSNEYNLMPLSLHALQGLVGFRTMRFNGIGMHRKRRLYVLVDSASTHNLSSEKSAHKLGCPFKLVKGVQVTIANGQDLQTSTTGKLWSARTNFQCESLHLNPR